MTLSFWKQFAVLLKHFFRVEIADSERWLSALLFAATILILFGFAFGSVNSALQAQVFIAQIFLTAFLAIQLSLGRVFESEAEDRAFDLMRTTGVSAEAWYLSKYIVVVSFGMMMLVPTMLLSAVFYDKVASELLSPSIAAIGGLVIFGLSAVGTLLAAVIQRAGARAILFPLIYLPLTAPVLLAAIQSALAIMVDGQELGQLLTSWLGMLAIFDMIYLVLGLLLFSELVRAD